MRQKVSPRPNAFLPPLLVEITSNFLSQTHVVDIIICPYQQNRALTTTSKKRSYLTLRALLARVGCYRHDHFFERYTAMLERFVIKINKMVVVVGVYKVIIVLSEHKA